MSYSLHYIQGVFRIAVQIDQNRIKSSFQHVHDVIEAGRIRGELQDPAVLMVRKSLCRRSPALLVWADQRYIQCTGNQLISNLDSSRHD